MNLYARDPVDGRDNKGRPLILGDDPETVLADGDAQQREFHAPVHHSRPNV